MGMRDRCWNSKHRNWRHYGGRGITICERWQTFENFLADMGERPSNKYSIDRIDNDLLIDSYSKSNCRWATTTEQRRNSRQTKLTADSVNEIRGRAEHGESKCSLMERFNVSRSTITNVIQRHTWRDVP